MTLLWLLVAVLIYAFGYLMGEWHEERRRDDEWWAERGEPPTRIWWQDSGGTKMSETTIAAVTSGTDTDATPDEKIAAVHLVLESRGLTDQCSRQLDMIDWILGGEDGARSPSSVQLFIDAIEATQDSGGER